MVVRVLSCVLAGLVAVAACVNADTSQFPPPNDYGYGGSGTGAGGGQGTGGGLVLDGGPMGPPPADASGLCGNEIHQITWDPPTVYFVFDISGSMATPVQGGTRLSVVRSAAVSLVSSLKYVIKAGAAAFPAQSTTNACQPGGEIYPPHFNDPSGFALATAGLQAFGGTPTAATFTALTPKLAAIAGKTIVVLSTDGGPNCDPNATCSISDCQENIEGCAPGDTCCAMQTNCCAPGGPAGPSSCNDTSATVSAVAAMAAAGVKVYVVGIPGSEAYANVLTQMAFAGGAAMTSAPFYYAVSDLSVLETTFKTIAGGAIPCDITVDNPPSMTGNTNVYLDQMLVLYDPTNGWTWSAPNVVTLHGAACMKLQSGDVMQVQVVSGCPTQGTK